LIAHRWFAAILALVLGGGVVGASLVGRANTPQTLRVAITEAPESVNPIVASLVVDNDVFSLVYNGLTRFDDRGIQIPDLAQQVPTLANGGISRDGRVITYRLVPNVRWNDGKALTSRDVAFSFAAYRNPGNDAAVDPTYDAIARLETPDPSTVRIVLRHPWAPALALFSGGSGGVILPEHLLSKEPDLNRVDFTNPMLGSGPYRISAWHRGSDMTFEANPTYFRGAPHIARLRLAFLPNDNTMLVGILAGDIDLADNIDASIYDTARKSSSMAVAMNARSSWDHLTFNTARGPLADVRVRRALCYGFDLNEIYHKVYHGLGLIGPVAQNPRTMWYNRRLHPYPYDVAKAAALLDAAGWRRGPDGIRTKNGGRLNLTLVTTSGNHAREQAEIFLQSAWQALGVETTIKNADASLLYAPAAGGGPLNSGNFDVAIGGQVSPTDPSLSTINGSDQIPPHGRNYSFFRNAEITRLEEAGASTYDVAQRKRIYDRIQEIELSELPYYVLRWNEIISLHAPALTGIRPSPTESTFWNVMDWRWSR
jgi:peptide/nickel transport system substrate-binding protein